MEWFCFKCNKKAQEAELEVEYMEFPYKLTGLRCPECGLAFFDEQQVKKVIEYEDAVEQK